MTPRHTLMALLVVVIWGLNFLAIDFGLEGVPPLLFLAMRFTLVVIPAIFFLKPPTIGWRNILLIAWGSSHCCTSRSRSGCRPASHRCCTNRRWC